jgi:hypothetical protein
MHPILAESLDGWLFAAALMFGGLAASLLALGALFPAWRGDRWRTIAFIAPALIVTLLVTLFAAYGYITDGVGDPDSSIADFIAPWVFLAGPSFVTSLSAALVLWIRSKKRMKDAG